MLFYSSRLSFSCGGVGKPPFSRAGRAGGLTCGATMARLGPRYGSGRFSLRATSSRVEGDGLAGTGAAPMVSFPVCAPRSFFSFWFATIPASVSQAHRSEYRSAQREGSPGPPPRNATRTHTGAMKVHPNRQINSLLRPDSSSRCKNQDAKGSVSRVIPPLTGCFGSLSGF